MIDLTNVNRYSVEELAEALRSGECTYDDYIQAWLIWDKRAALEPVVEEMKKEQEAAQAKEAEKQDMIKAEKQNMINEEAMDWDKAVRSCTIKGYEMYKQKWSAPRRAEYAQHLLVAEARIHYYLINDEINCRPPQRKQVLLKDMRENPWRYPQDLLHILFRTNSTNLTDAIWRYIQEKEFNQPYADFVLWGNKLSMSDLRLEDVFSKNLTGYQILAPDLCMPVTQIEDMGELPIDRTDVYFLGLPRSGKSSVLASIAYKLCHDQPKAFKAHLVNGVFKSIDYYECLVGAILSNKPPQGTAHDTVSFLKVDLAEANSTRKHPLNLVDYSGSAFKTWADRFISSSEDWKDLGFTKYLSNNNHKVLFFVLDYSIISNKEPENPTSEKRQTEYMERALNVLTHDGPDPKNPQKGCSMSKVDTVAVIMTKCDLMNVNSHKERLDLTMEYINMNMRHLMHNLSDACKTFGINKSNDYHPYIMAYSLGKFYVGNTFIIDEEDPANLIDFLANVTPENQSSK